MIRRRRPRFYSGMWKDIAGCLFDDKCNEDLIGLFEDRFAAFIDSRNAISCCSGRNAMELILSSIGLEQGDEVIIPAYTLKDLVPLIKKLGFKVVFCDVEDDSFNIDPDAISKKITPRTGAIMATHLFGVPCDMERILSIAREHGVKVIEDCAHAAGAEYKGRKVGSLGDASFFSFELTKPVNTFGGGMITCNDDTLASGIREKISEYPLDHWGVVNKIVFLCFENLMVQGPLFPLLIRIYRKNEELIKRLYWKAHAGTRQERTRFTSLQARLGMRQLERLKGRESLRREKGARITSALPDTVIPQSIPRDSQRVYYFLVVKIREQKPLDEVKLEMLSRGVDCGIAEEITDNCPVLFGSEGEDFPAATRLYSVNLQLPIYDEMTDREILKITGSLREVLGAEEAR
ncbi:MAG: aminotransferase class I/II-fold pyridoxal phosphate-dependent enzyme [Candidatus Omnitrophica bacterium]|nr:aminotransferase class I/II-fold pyridoxal phosphate-dependent enzyme [Candidatus Omnitrophota bacterium]